MLEFLLENEADVDVEDKDGWKPIHAAACWGNVRFITLIDSVMLVALSLVKTLLFGYQCSKYWKITVTPGQVRFNYLQKKSIGRCHD